jgi:hypothetical protein
MKKIIVLSLLLLAGSIKMLAQQPEVITSNKEGWHKIGETTVDFKTETDEILVLGADRFGFLKFMVTDAPINLISFEIYFADGSKQNVTIGKEIKAPGESRVVQLTGGERGIKKVTFVYKTIGNNNKDKKAHVELWGLKTAANKEKTNTNKTK